MAYRHHMTHAVANVGLDVGLAGGAKAAVVVENTITAATAFAPKFETCGRTRFTYRLNAEAVPADRQHAPETLAHVLRFSYLDLCDSSRLRHRADSSSREPLQRESSRARSLQVRSRRPGEMPDGVAGQVPPAGFKLRSAGAPES